MEDLFGLLVFLIFIVVSVLESVRKARRKKGGGGEAAAKTKPRAGMPRKAAPPRRAAPPMAPARTPSADVLRGPSARTAGRARPAPRPTQAPAARDVAELLRQRLEEMGARLPEEASSWEVGMRAEEAVEEAARVPALEEVRRREERERGPRPTVAEKRVPEFRAREVRRARELALEPEVAVRRRRPLPAFDDLSVVQRVVVWAEIFGPPVAERELGPTAPFGLRL